MWKRQTLVGCLAIAFGLLLACHCKAEQPSEIRKEIDRLRSEVSDRLKKIADLEAKWNAENPPQGLEGYCPVTMIDKSIWIRGNPKHSVTRDGIVYLFAGEQQQKDFQRSPEKYTPLMYGYDPVTWYDYEIRIAGRREHGVFLKKKIILFDNEETLKRFLVDPGRYLTKQPPPAPTIPLAPLQYDFWKTEAESVDAENSVQHQPTTQRFRRRRLRLWRR